MDNQTLRQFLHVTPPRSRPELREVPRQHEPMDRVGVSQERLAKEAGRVMRVAAERGALVRRMADDIAQALIPAIEAQITEYLFRELPGERAIWKEPTPTKVDTTDGRWPECASGGFCVPEEKLTATICGRCRVVLEDRSR